MKSYTSLAVLNAGQAVLFTFGLASTMVLCATEIRAGTKTVGDFVLINAMMIQLYQPLNMLGFAYREIRNALVSMERMFGLLDIAAHPHRPVRSGCSSSPPGAGGAWRGSTPTAPSSTASRWRREALDLDPANQRCAQAERFKRTHHHVLYGAEPCAGPSKITRILKTGAKSGQISQILRKMVLRRGIEPPTY